MPQHPTKQAASKIGSVTALLAFLISLATTAAVTAAPALASTPTFGTMNDQGGIYRRSAPNWNTPVAQTGNGFYPGTSVRVLCYRGGTTVPGSANTMWVSATWAGGPGHGSGWMNEHFVNDGAAINKAAGGVPPCGSPPPPPATNAQRAIAWAQSKLGQTSWDGYCLGFVYQAYLYWAGVNITNPNALPYGPSHDSAYTYWTVAPNHHSDRTPPAGALVFWRSVASPTGYGHVELSEGGGTIISSYDSRTPGIHTFNINSYPPYLYLG